MKRRVSSFAESFKNASSSSSQEKIDSILGDINGLSDVDKFLLYLQLPSGTHPEIVKDTSSSGKADVSNTQQWIRTHLQEDPELCLPKQEVYDEYREYCGSHDVRPVCREDFGKLMKTVFPNIKSRRLGTRGQTKHCYGGLTTRSNFAVPKLPKIRFSDTQFISSVDEQDDDAKSQLAKSGSIKPEVALERKELARASCALICEWAEKLLQLRFSSIHDIAEHLIEHSYVRRNSEAAYTIMSHIQRFRRDNNLQAPASAPDAVMTSGPTSQPVRTRSAKQQLHLKLQQKGKLQQQKRKLQQQRSVISGEGMKEDSSSQDTLPAIQENDVSMDSISNHDNTSAQSSKDTNSSSRSRAFPSVANQKPILPKPPTSATTPGISTSTALQISTSSTALQPHVFNQEPVLNNKVVLVSPPPPQVLLISPAPGGNTQQHQLPIATKQTIMTNNKAGDIDDRNNSCVAASDNANRSNKSDISKAKVEAARVVVSRAVSVAMAANSPSNQTTSHSNTELRAESDCQNDTKSQSDPSSKASTPVNGLTATSQNPQITELLKRSQSEGDVPVKGEFCSDISEKNTVASQQADSRDGDQPGSTNETENALLAANIDINSLLSNSLVVNLPGTGGEGNPVAPVAVPLNTLTNALQTINLLSKGEDGQGSGTSSTGLPPEILNSLSTQVLAALAQQQLSSAQFTPTKKTKTVSSLLREQRVKNTSPEGGTGPGATRSHYVNDNRPVAQILKELREKKRIGGGGISDLGAQLVKTSAAQKLTFNCNDTAQSNDGNEDSGIISLKERIAHEANFMKKAAQIKKECVSRDVSPAHSPAAAGLRNSRANSRSTAASREHSPTGSPATRPVKRTGTLSRDTSPIGSPVGRLTRGRAFSSSKVEAKTRKVEMKRRAEERARLQLQRKSILANQNKQHGEQSKHLNNNDENTAMKLESMLSPSVPNNQDSKFGRHNRSLQLSQNVPGYDSFLSQSIDETVFSPDMSSAYHSSFSTACNSNASNDSFESSFTQDRSRHSSGDLSLRSRHSSGDPNPRLFPDSRGGSTEPMQPLRSHGESVCASNNPTLVSLLSPDTGPQAGSRNLRLAQLLQEQDPVQIPPPLPPVRINQFANNDNQQAFSNQMNSNVEWSNNAPENYNSHQSSTLQQCLSSNTGIQSGLSGMFSSNMSTSQDLTNTSSQFVPIHNVTEANSVSPIRPQAMSVGESLGANLNMPPTSRESQAAQRLRLLLSEDRPTNNPTQFTNPADTPWLNNNQSSGFVPYNQTCSVTNNTLNAGPDQMQLISSETDKFDSKAFMSNFSVSNANQNDGFVSMEGVRPPKRYLETNIDQAWLSKRQRHHSDQTPSRRSKPRQVNFMTPVQPLLIPESKPAPLSMGQGMTQLTGNDSLPLLSAQVPQESAFSPEVQAIMSNDNWDMQNGNIQQGIGYRSHSVPAPNFLQQRSYDGLDSLLGQQTTTDQNTFDTSQSYVLQQQQQLQQNHVQIQGQRFQIENTPAPLDQSMQGAYQQHSSNQHNAFQQQQHNQQQHLVQSSLHEDNLQQNLASSDLQLGNQSSVNAASGSFQSNVHQMDDGQKMLLRIIAQKISAGSKDSGIRGDHMISGASVQQPQMRERIKDTLLRLQQQLQQQQQQRSLQQQQQASVVHHGTYSNIPGPTPPQSHPPTPTSVDFGQDMEQGGGMMGNIMLPSNSAALDGSVAMGVGMENAGLSGQQDPLLALCAADDNDNINMLDQSAQLGVFL